MIPTKVWDAFAQKPVADSTDIPQGATVQYVSTQDPASTEQRKFRVLVCDAIDLNGIEILRTVADVDHKLNPTEDQVCEIIGDYDAFMGRSGTAVTKRIIQKGRKLKIIGRAGVGVDNIDVETATSQGIFVVNSPQGNTLSVAEYTIGLMFALARKIPAADASLRTATWNREPYMGVELQRKTLGVIGFGQIGRHVAKVCKELGMELMCYDPYVNVELAKSLGCRVATLDELVTEADVVTIHVPLIPSTKNLINEEKLNRMKKTALLINMGRGGVVDEIALCKALHAGRIGGAALDVFEVEGKMDKDSPLLSAPNLVITPHIGAQTVEAQINVAVDAAEQIRSTLLGSLPRSAVNMAGLRVAESANLKPSVEGVQTAAPVLSNAAK